MSKPKYKLKENYRDFDIFIYRAGPLWTWSVEGCSKYKITKVTSMAYYFGPNSALTAARKYIDKKKV